MWIFGKNSRFGDPNEVEPLGDLFRGRIGRQRNLIAERSLLALGDVLQGIDWLVLTGRDSFQQLGVHLVHLCKLQGLDGGSESDRVFVCICGSS